MTIPKSGRRSRVRLATACAMLGALWAIGLLIVAPPALAQQSLPLVSESAARYDQDTWDIARGGQLYDNWAVALDKEPPEKTHPSYPSVGKREGGVTWRCKECHGWDYMGEDGADRHRHHYVKARVRVHEYPDGTLAVFHGPRRLACYTAQGEPIDEPDKRAA